MSERRIDDDYRKLREAARRVVDAEARWRQSAETQWELIQAIDELRRALAWTEPGKLWKGFGRN
jgi:hypothetical protein